MATGGEPDGIVFEFEPGVLVTKFESKIINLKRFAYDVFVFSADNFRLPSSCIPELECPKNDYGHHDFLLVISRAIFRYQIAYRGEWNNFFEKCVPFEHLESMETNKTVGSMWTLLLKRGTFDKSIPLSLALTSELILYLYSKSSQLYLDKLAKMWARWIYYHKEKFQEAGGLTKLYRLGLTSEFECDDDINNYFIPQRCFPYEASAKNPLLSLEWLHVYKEFKKIAQDNEIPPPTTVRGRPDSRSNVALSVKTKWFKIVYFANKEVACSSGKSEACEEQTMHREGLSSSSSGLEQPLQQMSLEGSERKESRENKPSVSEIRDTSSQNVTGAILKNPANEPKGSSVEAKGQTENSEQAKELSSSDSSEDEQSGELSFPEAKSSQNIPVASSQEATGKSSGKKKWQRNKSKKKKSRSRSRK